MKWFYMHNRESLQSTWLSDKGRRETRRPNTQYEHHTHICTGLKVHMGVCVLHTSERTSEKLVGVVSGKGKCLGKGQNGQRETSFHPLLLYN
jgi:hypothetical protein